MTFKCCSYRSPKIKERDTWMVHGRATKLKKERVTSCISPSSTKAEIKKKGKHRVWESIVQKSRKEIHSWRMEGQQFFP
jgi:hypothetical protein